MKSRTPEIESPRGRVALHPLGGGDNKKDNKRLLVVLFVEPVCKRLALKDNKRSQSAGHVRPGTLLMVKMFFCQNLFEGAVASHPI